MWTNPRISFLRTKNFGQHINHVFFLSTEGGYGGDPWFYSVLLNIGYLIMGSILLEIVLTIHFIALKHHFKPVSYFIFSQQIKYCLENFNNYYPISSPSKSPPWNVMQFNVKAGSVPFYRIRSKLYILSNSVRPNCPLLPILYILALELFLCKVRANPFISKTKLSGATTAMQTTPPQSWQRNPDVWGYCKDQDNSNKTVELQLGSWKCCVFPNTYSWTDGLCMILCVWSGPHLQLKKNSFQVLEKVEVAFNLWFRSVRFALLPPFCTSILVHQSELDIAHFQFLWRLPPPSFQVWKYRISESVGIVCSYHALIRCAHKTAITAASERKIPRRPSVYHEYTHGIRIWGNWMPTWPLWVHT